MNFSLSTLEEKPRRQKPSFTKCGSRWVNAWRIVPDATFDWALSRQKMWNLIRDERYVSNPRENQGRHTRGTAVDVTLVGHTA